MPGWKSHAKPAKRFWGEHRIRRAGRWSGHLGATDRADLSGQSSAPHNLLGELKPGAVAGIRGMDDPARVPAAQFNDRARQIH